MKQTPWRKSKPNPNEITVSGYTFPTIRRLHEFAVKHGFDGTTDTLRERLNRGIDTIDKLIAPIDRAAQEKVNGWLEREREEIKRVCEELDRRKSEIAARNKRQEDEDE